MDPTAKAQVPVYGSAIVEEATGRIMVFSKEASELSDLVDRSGLSDELKTNMKLRIGYRTMFVSAEESLTMRVSR